MTRPTNHGELEKRGSVREVALLASREQTATWCSWPWDKDLRVASADKSDLGSKETGASVLQLQ